MTKERAVYTARGYENAAGKCLDSQYGGLLEMIHRLSRVNGYTRLMTLAENLNVQPPSVTRMIQKLYDRSLLDYEKYGMIHLTDKGTKLGEYFWIVIISCASF